VIRALRALPIPTSTRDPGSRTGYTVTHSAETVAVRADGRAPVAYDASTSADDLTDDLRLLADGRL